MLHAVARHLRRHQGRDRLHPFADGSATPEERQNILVSNHLVSSVLSQLSPTIVSFDTQDKNQGTDRHHAVWTGHAHRDLKCHPGSVEYRYSDSDASGDGKRLGVFPHPWTALDTDGRARRCKALIERPQHIC